RTPLTSELQLRGKLCLTRVEHVPGRPEAERRRRWRVRVVDASPDGIHILHIGAVEQVEDVERQLEPGAAVHGKVTPYPEVHARISRPLVRIAADRRRPIGVGIAIEVEVAACKNVEWPAALCRHDCAHPDTVENGDL